MVRSQCEQPCAIDAALARKRDAHDSRVWKAFEAPELDLDAHPADGWTGRGDDAFPRLDVRSLFSGQNHEPAFLGSGGRPDDPDRAELGRFGAGQDTTGVSSSRRAHHTSPRCTLATLSGPAGVPVARTAGTARGHHSEWSARLLGDMSHCQLPWRSMPRAALRSATDRDRPSRDDALVAADPDAVNPGRR